MIDEIVTEEIQELLSLFREKLDEGDFCEADNYRRRILLHDNYLGLKQNPELMLRYLDYSIEFYQTIPVEEENPIRIKVANFLIRCNIRQLRNMRK